MPCLCYEPGDYTCTGNGATLLTNPSLTWLLTTDGLLGTTPELPGMPNGNLNQMFWKLLQNDCSLANFVYNTLTRTYGVNAISAPSVGVLPDSFTGAPVTPTSGSVHIIYFNDFEVTYRYDSVSLVWTELARLARTSQVVVVTRKKLILALDAGDVEIPFAVPTSDDNNNAFTFSIDDLALVYVNNTDAASPIIGIVPGFNLAGGTIRLVLTTPVPLASGYELVAIFRRTTIN